MLIRCPTCASGYDLPPDVLSDGRILRCAHCRDAFVHRDGTADRHGPEIAAEASAFRVAGASMVALSEPRRRIRASIPPLRPFLQLFLRPFPRPRVDAGVAGSLLVATLLFGAGAAVACKARLVAQFPPSETVFATLGLPVNLSGLALGELRSTVAGGDGPQTLTLEARITNLRPDATPVPVLRIAVRDKGGRELYHWTAPPPKDQLAAGETVLFRGRLTAPPRDAQDLAVSFAGAAPGRRRLAEAVPSDR